MKGKFPMPWLVAAEITQRGRALCTQPHRELLFWRRVWLHQPEPLAEAAAWSIRYNRAEPTL